MMQVQLRDFNCDKLVGIVIDDDPVAKTEGQDLLQWNDRLFKFDHDEPLQVNGLSYRVYREIEAVGVRVRKAL